MSSSSSLPATRLSSFRLTRRNVLCLAGSGVVSAAAAPSRAAGWPGGGVVRIVIPFPGGASSDVVARLLADRLGAAFGAQFIVDSKPGANGIIATDAVAKAAPDGRTLLLTSSGHAINASLYRKLPYDPARDFVPVALVAPPGPLVIAVNPALPVRDVRELIDYAKRNPGAVGYASGGVGNALHLAGEMFAHMAGVKMLHVPYKGAAPALNDLVGGQVQLMFNSSLAVAPFVRDGKLRLLAQTGAKRSPAMPDLPTVAESGLPGYEATGWFGLFAPARTPADVVQRLNAETNRAMALPELRDKLKLLGSTEPPTLGPEAFARFVADETARYARVIQAAGIGTDAPTQ